MDHPLTIDILIPTRGRPANIEKVSRSICESLAQPKLTGICFYVDNDDPASNAMTAKLRDAHVYDGLREVQVLIGNRLNLAETYNTMATYLNGAVMMYAADDIEFRTPGWDDVVRNAFWESGDRIWLMWAKDRARGDNPFPDHGFISRWSKQVLKYFFPVFPPHPKFPNAKGCSYTDIWLEGMYRHLGRVRYLSEIEIAHNHWATREGGAEGPMEFDRNYAIHSILSQWRRTPEFDARNAEMPEHASRLTRWVEFVERERPWLAENGWAPEETPCEPSTEKAATDESSSTPSAPSNRTRKSSGRTTRKGRGRKRTRTSSAG